MLGGVGQPAFYRQIASMDQTQTDEIQSIYDPMSCEVRVLWGDKDDWIPFARGKEFAEFIDGGNITRIENARHLMQEDAPEAIVAAMLDRGHR
ncbi:MAG: pimeloyl-ACP methyl ester carboxylesterase [Arenicella sp.]